MTFLCQSLKKELNLFKEFNIENVVTLETSYFGCVKGNYPDQYFIVNSLGEIGRDICIGISSWNEK